MDENKSPDRSSRVGFLKKVIIITVILLLVFPNITCIAMMIKQTELEAQINALTREVANMKLERSGDLGRIDYDSRMSVAAAFPEYFSGEDSPFFDVAVAEAEKAVEDAVTVGNEIALASDEVVWTFSASGDVSEAPHKVYLTFDDGPSAYTDDILDILNEYGVKATFFVVGKDSETDIELYKRIVDEGHTLGMHSYSHVYSDIYASEESFTQDLDRITTLLTEATGEEPKFYRFPGGSSNTVSRLDMHRFIDIVEDKGLTYFDWNVSSGDATKELLSAQQIQANAVSGIQNRETTVILMHDSLSKPTTVQALPGIIEKILAMDGTEILPITSDTEPVRHVE